MEMVYPRQPKTDIAGVYLRELDSGGPRCLFSQDVNRTFWEDALR